MNEKRENKQSSNSPLFNTIIFLIILALALPFLSFHVNTFIVGSSDDSELRHTPTGALHVLGVRTLTLVKKSGQAHTMVYDENLKTRFMPALDPQYNNEYPDGLPSWVNYAEFEAGNITFHEGTTSRPVISKKFAALTGSSKIDLEGFGLYVKMFWEPVYRYKAFFNNKLILHFF